MIWYWQDALLLLPLALYVVRVLWVYTRRT